MLESYRCELESKLLRYIRVLALLPGIVFGIAVSLPVIYHTEGLRIFRQMYDAAPLLFQFQLPHILLTWTPYALPVFIMCAFILGSTTIISMFTIMGSGVLVLGYSGDLVLKELKQGSHFSRDVSLPRPRLVKGAIVLDLNVAIAVFY